MATSGNVKLTIADGGATVTLPAAGLQVVLGCSSTGSTNTVLATAQASTLQSTYGYGPLPEAAAMVIAAGGTVLAIRLPTVTAGAVVAGSPINIVSSTNANPIEVTATAHGLLSGDVVTISGHLVNTAANGTWKITKTGTDTFTIAVAGVGVGAGTGTVTWTGAKQTGTGTSANYFDGAAYDDLYVLVTWTVGGTIGTTGPQFTVSLDAARSQRLVSINLGTATSYTIPQTNITMHLESGKTVVAGDTVRCHSTAPLWNVSGVTAALAALIGSPYADSGWGSMHLVGTIGGADAGTVGAYLETMATTNLLYDRMIGESRDASPPVAWGGTGETDSTWSSAVLADFVTTTAKRFAVDSGYYNMRSAFSNPVAGTPLYRRPIAWAHACRIVELPRPADLESWRSLGALSQITEDTVNDPVDGFVYHDEQAGAVFDATLGGPGRMGSGRHVRRFRGWFLSRPLTLAATGSDFALLPNGRVIDLASDIIQEVLGPDIDGRVKLNANGTIREKDAAQVETDCYRALDNQIGDLYSGRTIVVDRAWNIRDTSIMKIRGTIERDGYVLEIDFSLGFGTTA